MQESVRNIVASNNPIPGHLGAVNKKRMAAIVVVFTSG